MKLTLGFSPCPNDTFIFDALVNKKIDTGGWEVEAILEDVETLNRWALEGRLAISKMSFPALFQSSSTYSLLDAGSALGKGVGPLLIAKEALPNEASVINESTIAIPGLHTTANLLLSFAFPSAQKKIPMIFSEIENAVLSGKTKLGVIIHENRFTYQERGLHKLLDLGAYWETHMQVPIPLGAIAIKKSLGVETGNIVNALIRKSLEYAFENYPTLPPYVREHSSEMSEEVMRKHIDLYVNNYSLDLGMEGKKAIEVLRGVFEKQQAGHVTH
jgi:1,4-dihydroxy-6-naphthoate synthase